MNFVQKPTVRVEGLEETNKLSIIPIFRTSLRVSKKLSPSFLTYEGMSQMRFGCSLWLNRNILYGTVCK
jgi:hypothetical protein